MEQKKISDYLDQGNIIKANNLLQESQYQYPPEWTNGDQVTLYSGINTQWCNTEEEKIQDFQCSICCCIVWKPTQCKVCENHFCTYCIEQHQVKVNQYKCPFNCQNFQCQKAGTFFYSNLAKLTFKCPFFMKGCNSKINYQEFEQHLNACLFRLEKNVHKYQIQVSDTLIKQELMFNIYLQPYVVYLISTIYQGKQYQVARRYQNFKWLDNYLRQTHLGFIIPILPKQEISYQVLYKSSPSTDEGRRDRLKSLEQYLEIVSSQMYAEKDQILKDFLTQVESDDQVDSGFISITEAPVLEVYAYWDSFKRFFNNQSWFFEVKNSELDKNLVSNLTKIQKGLKRLMQMQDIFQERLSQSKVLNCTKEISPTNFEHYNQIQETANWSAEQDLFNFIKKELAINQKGLNIDAQFVQNIENFTVQAQGMFLTCNQIDNLIISANKTNEKIKQANGDTKPVKELYQKIEKAKSSLFFQSANLLTDLDTLSKELYLQFLAYNSIIYDSQN